MLSVSYREGEIGYMYIIVTGFGGNRMIMGDGVLAKSYVVMGERIKRVPGS